MNKNVNVRIARKKGKNHTDLSFITDFMLLNYGNMENNELNIAQSKLTKKKTFILKFNKIFPSKEEQNWKQN